MKDSRPRRGLSRVVAGSVMACSVMAFLGVAALLPGCNRELQEPAPDESPPPTSEIVLTDVTADSGVAFIHRNDASARRLLAETMGSGVAVFDADGDGLADLLFADGAPLEAEPEPESGPRLYRNLGDFRFAEATAGSGLRFPYYAMGIAIGDVDGDGALDAYVTGVGGDRLFRNRGDGTFNDETAAWGLPFEGGFGTSAAFFDADADGDLDLFAGRYVEWSPATDRACSPDGEHRVYCTPEVYPPAKSRFYLNLGNRFEEATEEAGLAAPGKALGVVVLDHGGDGRLDLAVANDTEPNFLFLNRGGTFRDAALELGFALGPSGRVRGGMGIAAGDLDDDSREEVVIGNFANEMAALFDAGEDWLYGDAAASARLGMATLVPLAFGTVIADLDGDGRLDVAFANGHIEPAIVEVSDGRESWAQRMQVFRGGEEGFEEAPGIPERALVGRGLACGDLDLDGDVDLVVTQNGAGAVLLRNDSPPSDWLRLRLRGRGGNTWGYGAAVTVELGGGRRLTRRLDPSGSYLSSSEPVLTLGLGRDTELRALSVRWPGGGVDDVAAPELRQEIEVVQGEGGP